MQWRETKFGHALLQGNHFSEIERGPDGRPSALWPLRPDCMEKPIVSESRQLLYPYHLPNGQGVLIPQRNIHHLRGLSSDGVWGYTPITVHRETLGLALGTREYGARWFGQGARPGGVLQSKGKLSKDAADRMRESWIVAHSGLSNAHRVAILEEGVEWHQVGMSAEDAQYLASRQFDIQEICRMLGVAPYKLYEESRSTFSNIEVQGQDFEQDSIRSWCVRDEQQMRKDLFAADPGYFAEYNMDGLLRANAAARAALYANGRQWGWLNGNEIRRRENMNTVDGLDDYSQPANAGAAAAPTERSS
jgi:HK97 family phage portal protein